MGKKRYYQNIFEQLKTNPRRSDAFNWFMENYEAIDGHRHYWGSIVSEFEKKGFRDTFGRSYSKTLLRKLWYKVKKAKAREAMTMRQITSLNRN